MKTNWRTIFFACGLVLTVSAIDGAQEPAKGKSRRLAEPTIAIFIGPQTRDGFVDVDRGVLDSIKDLTSELRGRKGLRIVDNKDGAQIIIEVVSRGATSSAGGGSVAMPIGASTFYIPIGTIGLATVLRVGAYEKPFVLQNCQSWRHCAKLVAKDVETWLDANASVVNRESAGKAPAVQ